MKVAFIVFDNYIKAIPILDAILNLRKMLTQKTLTLSDNINYKFLYFPEKFIKFMKLKTWSKIYLSTANGA